MVAAGLARLLEVDDSAFAEQSFSIEAFKIFDGVFPGLYKLSDLQVRDQTHLKRQAILDQLQDATQPLSVYVGDELRKEHISDARGTIERYIRKPNAVLLVWPLVPHELRSRGEIVEILLALDSAVSARERSLDDVENVRNLRAKHEMLVSQCKSSYYDTIVEPLLQRLFEAFEILVGADPAFQPTELKLSFPDRRYPLKAQDALINIRVAVENTGPGRASDVVIAYETTLSERGLQYLSIGTLNAGVAYFDLPETVDICADEALVDACVSWCDIKGPHEAEKCTNERLVGQRDNVDWNELRYSDPYSTEPVDSVGELIGRSEQLEMMKSHFLGRIMPSYYITGQKRVGKTSLAKTLCHILRTQKDGTPIHTVYLEGGDYIADDGQNTIRRLCELIRRDVATAFPALSFAAPPGFGENLSDLKALFDQLWAVYPETRVLIALDEFDELPFELFTKGAMSRSVFLALRGLSGKQNLGFAIVGSEKMALIMNEQGEHLNKWDNVSLDYFSKNHQWSDYRDLVTRPTSERIDFSDDSISDLYDQTAGHPFFTKLICRRILEDACDRRVSYIDSAIVARATTVLCDLEEVNRFQHFWEDGIFAPPEARVDTIELRKRVLLAAADLMRRGRPLTVGAIEEHPLLSGLARGAAGELQSFQRRNILTLTQGEYRFKIPLFRQWLMNIGAAKILIDLPASDLISGYRDEEALRVSPAEIAKVCNKWIYRWRAIEAENVRDWLSQFGSPRDQRLMFTLLKHIRYYSGAVCCVKLQDAYKALAHRYVSFREAGTLKRGDILVSYLDGPGKSGSQLAKTFANENKIYAGSVVEQSKLLDRIQTEEGLQAVVCVDDFLGTGRTAIGGLRKIWKEVGAAVEDRKIGFHFIALAGFASAVSALEDAAGSLSSRIVVSVCDHLTEQDRAFSEGGVAFDSAEDRLHARDVAFGIGKTLVPNAPLGHSGGQALVVFETNCPNNSLPILWSKGKGWRPLFERV